MEMNQIRYFLAVCDMGAFTKAAQFVYVSQPSLTQAIKKLEDELGGELFTRDRAGCRLTELGRLVEPNLRHIFRETQAIKAEAIRFNRLSTVPLRLGLMTTVGPRRLSPFLAAYQHDNPHIELELIVDNEVNLLRQLDSGYLDLVISTSSASAYQFTLLYEERYVVAFSRQHPFNQLEQVDLQAIQAEPYLDRLNCELRETLKNLCEDRDINLYATYRSNNDEWILNMVRAGIGVALMPEFSMPADAESVCSRYLSAPGISRKILAIFARQSSLKPELQALLAKLKVGL